jgi:putative phage-type endonuclease
MPMLTAAQKEKRRSGIGSSDISAVLGINPMSSAIRVWCDKTGREEEAEQANENADLGNDLEPVIARRVIRELNLPTAHYETTHVHPVHPWALATPDWRLAPKHFLECKNVGWRMMHHWYGADGQLRVPEYVEAQVQWQMGVVGGERAHVAAILGGRDWLLREILFDPELFDLMLKAAGRFWHEHVVPDIQPPVDGSKFAAGFLAKRFGRGSDKVLVADEATRQLGADLRAACAALADAKLAQAVAKQRVQEVMGEHGVLDLGEAGRVTWNEVRGRVGWEKVARELGATPEMIEKHRGAPGRKFNTPKAWGQGDDE